VTPLPTSTLLAVSLFLSVPALAATIDVTSCGQTFAGRVALAGDLDCSATGLTAIELEDRSRLDLRGYTLKVGADDVAVHCLGSCTIEGPASSPAATTAASPSSGEGT
jgi:hypothetical protein